MPDPELSRWINRLASESETGRTQLLPSLPRAALAIVAVWLRYSRGHAYRDVASKLGVDALTARALISEGVKALQA